MCASRLHVSFRQKSCGPISEPHCHTVQQVNCSKATEPFQEAPTTVKGRIACQLTFTGFFFNLLRLTAQAAAKAGGDAGN